MRICSLDSIRSLIPAVKEAGNRAMRLQKALDYGQREMKPDGSVVTETDRQTEEFLCSLIARQFPKANLVGEEFPRKFDISLPWTWIIDPIDGTDNFTQGAHFWCVSVGLLDRRHQPVAGIVYAPRLELLLFADIGCPLEINGRPADIFPPVEALNSLSGLVVSSRILHFLDLRGFSGKIRSLGSAALQSCFPACYPGVVGVLQERQTFAWDIAAAHAILLAAGCRVAYRDGRPIDYLALQSNRWNLEDIMVAARPGAWDLLMGVLRNYPNSC
jgi:fructose-1,6-bisphosphatase/inositol monophosphatase family enzyme